MSLLLSGVFAQKAEIIGIVVDSTNEPVPFVTASLFTMGDTLLVNSAVGTDKGEFRIIGIDTGEYYFNISAVGLSEFNTTINVTADQMVYNQGTIQLTEDALLKEVSVFASKIPMIVKQDTVEFNASAFKTNPNDAVSELLKKVPGMEIDQDGNLTVNGENIGQILVNGKEFFGDDPKIALENLPADAIDKIKVYDQMSEKSEFTGVDDGERTKTLDLTVKKDRLKGFFGNATGGGGYDPESEKARYYGKASINRFTESYQLSLLGMMNNTNETGFSYSEFANFMGGQERMGRGSNQWNFNAGSFPVSFNLSSGETRTAFGGGNFNWSPSKKTDLNVSYMYYNIRNDQFTRTDRENFIDEGTYFSSRDENQESGSGSHRVNFRLEQRINKNNEITVEGSAGLRDNFVKSLTNDSTYSIVRGGQPEFLQNLSASSYNSFQDAYDYDASIFYKKKFNKRGRSLFIEYNIEGSNEANRIRLDSYNAFNAGVMLVGDSLIQNQTNDLDDLRMTAEISFTEKFGKDHFVELSVEGDQYRGDVDYIVYDVNPNTVVLNEFQSNIYEPQLDQYRARAAYRFIQGKINITAGISGQYAEINGDLQLQDVQLSKSFRNLLYDLSMRYNVAMGRSLNIEFKTKTNAPSIQQIQPVVDNSNPLYIYAGNPDLDQEYEYNFTARYHGFNQSKMSGWFTGIWTSYKTDAIVTATTIDSLLVSYSTPVNVPYDFTSYLWGTHVGEWQKAKLGYSISLNGNYMNGIQFLNGVENTSNRWTIGTSGRLMNKNADVLDVIIGANYSYTQTLYDVNAEFNQNFFSYGGFLDVNWNIGKEQNWLASSEFTFTTYQGQAFNSAVTVPLWNVSLSRFLWQKRGELKLFVFDVLGQNQGFSQQSQLNFVEDRLTNTVTRYFMLSFTWKITQMGKPDGGGMMRMWRRK